MFSFLKNLFSFINGDSPNSSLMEKARSSALIDPSVSTPNLTSEGLTRYFYDNEELEQLQMQQMTELRNQDLLMQQQQMQEMQNLQDLQTMQDLQHMQDMHDMSDPFQNPGQDMIVDDYHHNIDHGFDDHHHDY